MLVTQTEEYQNNNWNLSEFSLFDRNNVFYQSRLYQRKNLILMICYGIYSMIRILSK